MSDTVALIKVPGVMVAVAQPLASGPAGICGPARSLGPIGRAALASARIDTLPEVSIGT